MRQKGPLYSWGSEFTLWPSDTKDRVQKEGRCQGVRETGARSSFWAGDGGLEAGWEGVSCTGGQSVPLLSPEPCWEAGGWGPRQGRLIGRTQRVCEGGVCGVVGEYMCENACTECVYMGVEGCVRMSLHSRGICM